MGTSTASKRDLLIPKPRCFIGLYMNLACLEDSKENIVVVTLLNAESDFSGSEDTLFSERS